MQRQRDLQKTADGRETGAVPAETHSLLGRWMPEPAPTPSLPLPLTEGHFSHQEELVGPGQAWGAGKDPRAAVTMTTGGPAPACSILPASPRPAWVAQGPGGVWPVEGILTIHCPRSGLVTEAEETEPCPCPYLSTGPRGVKGEAPGKH